MTERMDPVAYYDSRANIFAVQASDENNNWFEYQRNMPSLLEMGGEISGDILDFGCGAGNFTAMLQREDRTVEGCDTSPSLLEIARKDYTDINFFSCSANGTMSTDKTYNLIVSKLVFHYVDDLESVIANISTKLSRGEVPTVFSSASH